MGPTAFDKHLRSVVPNFKEFKIQVNHGRGDSTKLVFPHRGRVCYIEVYREEWSLKPWVGHLINFFATGKMDTHAYWDTYHTEERKGNNTESVHDGDCHKVKLEIRDNGHFYPMGRAFFAFMRKTRAVRGSDIGFTQVSRPVKSTETNKETL